jgi:hypothetical protein
MQAIKTLGDSLNGLGDAMQKSGAPKELMAPLMESIDAFGEFAAMIGGGGKPEAPGQGVQDANAQGNPNAVPA